MQSKGPPQTTDINPVECFLTKQPTTRLHIKTVVSWQVLTLGHLHILGSMACRDKWISRANSCETSWLDGPTAPCIVVFQNNFFFYRILSSLRRSSWWPGPPPSSPNPTPPTDRPFRRLLPRMWHAIPHCLYCANSSGKNYEDFQSGPRITVRLWSKQGSVHAFETLDFLWWKVQMKC